MQVAITPGLGHLTGYFMAEQRRQSSGQFQQQWQIDAGMNADFIAQVHQILGADVSRCPRRKRAAAEAAEGRVEAAGTGLVGGQHVAQAEAAGVVKVQGQVRRGYPVSYTHLTLPTIYSV